VLVCTQGFPSSFDDIKSPFLLDHARALAGAGMDVTVLCPSGPGLDRRARLGAVDIVRFRYGPKRIETLANTGAMHQRVRGPAGLLLPGFVASMYTNTVREAKSADVVHAHWWAPTGIVAVAAAHRAGRPVVVHLHGTDVALAKGPLLRLARRVLNEADRVLAASPALAEWCRDATGAEADVVPMPLAPSRLPPSSPPPPDGPVIAAGRLVPEKGFDVFVRAVAKAGVRACIVGAGPEHDRLAALIADTGADIELVGGVSPLQMSPWFGKARVVAVPSRREGFGLVAAEASASRRPVIASAVGGLPSIVADGVNGVLVPPDDVDALAAALGDIDLRLGDNGPAQVNWLFPDAIADRTRASYERAVDRYARRSMPS
jgi:glycosyltransferase involved in cell wall biosynthesis